MSTPAAATPSTANAAPSLPPALEESVKKTIDLMSRIIKKPPLNTKLLSKPPFRYLHDMFSEIMRVSDEIGFAKGLYDETERNAENVKDKDAKVAYLLKMIDVIGMVTNVDIKANPLKIVAGMDPEDTNSFLQLLAKVVLKKADTSFAVKRVLAGEHFKKAATSAPQPSASAQQQQQSTAPRPQGDHEQRRQAPASAKPREAAKVETKEKPPRSSDNVQELEEEKQREHREKEKEREKEGDKENRHRDLAVREREGSRGVSRERASSDSEGEDSDKKVSLVPAPAVKRRERPTTARAPPPRLKGSDFAAVEEAAVSPTLIQEGVRAEESDDENYVIIGNNPDDDGGDKDRGSSDSERSDDENHGGLVRKILDAKGKPKNKDEDDAKEKGDPSEKPKEKSVAKKEIEGLRESIQTLCRSTNPLAKTMDYMQEDVDGMNKELEMWRKESKKYSMELEEASRDSYDALMPLDLKLKQIEENIEDMMDKIGNQKAGIIQNEVDLQRLLKMITHPVK
ncbi:TRAF3-interacting protein 1 [Chytriomyces hyalinus]|nr:TRAF3-interacting protein 1 [Chytriomyces hyalinus]